MEEPYFCQDDHLLSAAIENDLRAAHESQQTPSQPSSTSRTSEESAPQQPGDNGDDTNGNGGSKTMMQAVGEILAQSAHIVKDAVLNKHTSSTNSSGETLASSAREEETKTVDGVDAGADASEWSVMQAVGEIISHPVQSMKDMISGHYNLESVHQSEEECTTAGSHNTVSSVLGDSIESHRLRGESLADIVKEKDGSSNGGVGETLGAREEGSEEASDASEWSVMHVVGDIISHPVQSMKDMITGHYNHETVHKSEEDCNTTGSHNTVASVMEDSMENHRLRGAMENGDRDGEEAGEPQKKTMMESVSELISHSVETVKESVKEAVMHNGSVDHDSMEDVRSAILKQEAEVVEAEAAAEKQHEGGKEDKDLLQTVKEAAQSVKEAVLSNGSMAHASDSITEESGERPSMELVHTIVHD